MNIGPTKPVVIRLKPGSHEKLTRLSKELRMSMGDIVACLLDSMAAGEIGIVPARAEILRNKPHEVENRSKQ